MKSGAETCSSVVARTSFDAVVQEQLDAYNARDVQRLSAVYGEHVRIFRPPRIDPVLIGQAAVTRFYAAQRFTLAQLHAELLHRIVLGSVIIDHRRIFGVTENPFEVVGAYEVRDAQIQSVWFFTGNVT